MQVRWPDPPTDIMISTRLFAAALLGAFLLGCNPRAPAPTRSEHALANLNEHLKNERGATRLRPLVCDSDGIGDQKRLCHADMIQEHAGEEKKVGSSTFSCDTLPKGKCTFFSSSDADGNASMQTGVLPACSEPLRLMSEVDLQDVGRVTVSDYTESDTPSTAWVSAAFTLQDANIRLTQAEVTAALDQLIERIAASCRLNAVKKTRVFLYPAGVTAGESANWIARLDDGVTRNIDLNQALLKDERRDRYACVDTKEPGRSLDYGTRLPPVRQREIIGTWVGMNTNITMSLERVKGKVYRVYRSAYCASSDRGELLQTRPGGQYAVVDSRNGDYYQVMPSGDLGVFDRAGSIDVMPKHFALHPAPSPQ